VVINEAVELSKAFGSENSSRFINGVLGTVLRNITGETVEPLPAKEKKDFKTKKAEAEAKAEKEAK
jgi:N utilization substance protein B